MTGLLTGETFVRLTTAKQRRIINWVLFWLWLTAGTAIWLWLRNSLWFVGFMSLYAIWWSHYTAWSAETPVESEDE